MNKRKTIMVGTRVTEPFYRVMQAYLEKNSCLNESDLTRKALSEYLEKKIPETYREIMELR